MSLWTTKKYITTIDTLWPFTEYFGGHTGHDTLSEALAYRNEFNSDPDHPDRTDKYDFMGDPELNPRSDADK